jgi:hypothetical protein
VLLDLLRLVLRHSAEHEAFQYGTVVARQHRDSPSPRRFYE